MSDWTHFDSDGRPRMVDVSGKNMTKRVAVAEGWVYLTGSVYEAIKDKKNSKGDPFTISEIGGTMGAKQTSSLIPLCHNIKIDSVKVSCTLDDEQKAVRIECEAVATEATGVEMEALTGVSAAALTFYDMCKGIDKGMTIGDIRLLCKSGGKSGNWTASKTARVQRS